MEAVLAWLDGCRALPTVLVGDLNVYLPTERIPALLSAAGFASAHATLHGADPVTCPTPLAAPTIPPASSVESMRCDFVLVRQPADASSRCLHLRPTAASLAGDTPATGDDTLYPSDHYAVLATLEVA